MSIADEVAKLERRRIAGELTQSQFEAEVARVVAAFRPAPPPPMPPEIFEPDTEITTDGDLRRALHQDVADPFGGIPPKLPLPPTVQMDALSRAPDAVGEPASGPGRVAEPVPTRLGAYKLVELVGQGGMGLVYAAKHLVRPGLFAVKVPRPHLAADPDFVRRFRREARVGLKLDHHGIVKVHDLIIDGEYPAMVMDFVTGANLDTLLRNSGGPLAWARTRDIFGQVLDAIGYAHRQGCIHRDLKPKNIIVRPDGSALITDFGLARIADGESTQTDLLLGTASYLAPEVYVTGAQAGPAADIYALGMTLYKMVAGRLPFEPGSAAYAILRQKEAGKIDPPSRFNPDVPPEVDRLVMRALNPDPGARLPDCETFGVELQSVFGELQDEPTMPMGASGAGPLQAEATLPFTGPPSSPAEPSPGPAAAMGPVATDSPPDEAVEAVAGRLRASRHVAPTVQAPAVGRQKIRAPEPAISTRGRRIIGALAALLLAAVLANIHLLLTDQSRGIGGLFLGTGGDEFGAALNDAERRAALEDGLSQELPEPVIEVPASDAPPVDVDWVGGGAPGSTMPQMEDDAGESDKAEQVRLAVARELTAQAARDAVTRELGILHLSSTPPSQVTIDGVAYGSTEITAKGIPLPEGEHIVRFKCVSAPCEGLKHRGAKKTVEIQPGRTLRFHADFIKLNGGAPSPVPSLPEATSTPAETPVGSPEQTRTQPDG